MAAIGRQFTREEKAAGRLKEEREAMRKGAVQSALRGESLLNVVQNVDISHGSTVQSTIISDVELDRMMREGFHNAFLYNLMPKVLKYLENLLDNEGASSNARLRAAQLVTGIAGFVAPKATELPGSPDESMGKQTPAQLRAFIAQAQNELANRSTPVLEGKAVAPEVAPEIPAEAAGMLD